MERSRAQVEAVSASPQHGFSKQPRRSIDLLAGLGVHGDAHCGATIQHLHLKRKTPDAPNHMQVHLLQAELLDELATKGFRVGPGELGENILTGGIDLLTFPQGTRLQLGPHALLELTCLRQPCIKIDRFRSGLQREMTTVPGSPVRYRRRRHGRRAAGRYRLPRRRNRVHPAWWPASRTHHLSRRSGTQPG